MAAANAAPPSPKPVLTVRITGLAMINPTAVLSAHQEPAGSYDEPASA